MSLSDIDWYFLLVVLSVVLNCISVPFAIYFGIENRKNARLAHEIAQQSHENAQLGNKQSKVEELNRINEALCRIASIEHAKINGIIKYSNLIRDGVLTADLINDVVSKCKKYGISTKELTDFKDTANCALANKHWDNLSAVGLISAAKELSKTLQPHTNM